MTKTDENVFKSIVREVVQEELVPLRQQMKYLQGEMKGADEKLEKKLDDVLNKLDWIAGEVQSYRNEQDINRHDIEETKERVEKLEQLHPHGQHPAL